MMPSLLLLRIAIALVWMYHGFWSKLLGGAPRHRKIVESAPFLGSSRARQALAALGVMECALAAWVLSGVHAREAAAIETLLLVSMNAAGLLWARRFISDPVSMLLQNVVFLLLAWIAAGEPGSNASGA